MTSIVAAVIGAVVAGLFGLVFRKLNTIHVLVNSNLTAVTKALRDEVEKNTQLKSENAMLKGEPGSTHDVSGPNT